MIPGNFVRAICSALTAVPLVAGAGQSSPSFAERQKPMFALLKVEEAWKITRGGPACAIGVVDSGFDFFHPALRANLKPGWFAPGVYHTDFFAMDAHGTLVASIIGGRREDGSDGMWGLAPDCTILTASHGMPIHALARFQGEILAKNPNASMADIQKEMAAHGEELRTFAETWIDFVFGAEADAIRYLADHNARVINISGFLETTRLAAKPELKARFEAALAYAKEKDALIVLASGNNDRRVTDYPGDREFIIIAGASTLADRRWTMSTKLMGTEIRQGSSYGPRLNVVAPIENIVYAAPHEQAYYSWNDTPMGRQKTDFEAPYAVAPWGATSMAAPQVAALAALVRTIRPDLKAREIIRLIEQGADDIPPDGFDEETGYGRINFLKTLELARKAGTSQ